MLVPPQLDPLEKPGMLFISPDSVDMLPEDAVDDREFIEDRADMRSEALLSLDERVWPPPCAPEGRCEP